MKVKYDWINVANGADGQEITFPVIDTGFFRDWNLVQIEGEEPVSPAEVVDPKAKSIGKKAPAPTKGGTASRLEEITDNRARIISYERDCAAEAGCGLEVTEDVAYKLSETIMKLEIYDTHKETMEETLLDTISIDISCLLY